MRQRDPRNVRDALLEAGHSVGEVEAMLAAAEAYREFDRLEHSFDNATDLRFVDFAHRAQKKYVVALRLIQDIGPTRDWLSEGVLQTQQPLLYDWRNHAAAHGLET